VTVWRRAAAYFAACLVLAALVRPDLGWDAPALVVVGCLLLEVVAYGVIWPIGTYTLDRPRDWVSPAFGLVWGVCEGLLLLSVYAVTDRLLDPTWLVVLVTFVVASGFQGGWHAAYWDIHVAPDHNVPEWNLRKVLLCHVPNLAVTLPLLAADGAGGWFVVCQATALVLSSTAMRFARPSRAVPAGRQG
jgi:hypothetical protein